MTPIPPDAATPPFSNGDEERWWQSRWCANCIRDHGMHGDTWDDPGCDIFAGYLVTVGDPDFRWPEAWVPNRAQPANGNPAKRLVCIAFEACEPCGGDPAPNARAELVAEAREALKEYRRG